MEFLDRPALKGARAVADAFGLHAHALGHGEPEVGYGSAFWVLFVAVGLEEAATAARNQSRQVAAGVVKAAAQP